MIKALDAFRSESAHVHLTMFRELMKLHFRKFFREPAVIFWAFVFPIAMSWLLGLAFDRNHLPTFHIGIVPHEDNRWIDNLTRKVEKAQATRFYGDFKLHFLDEKQAMESMRHGSIMLYIEKIEKNWVYHFDPKNKEAKETYLLIENLRLNDGKTSYVQPITQKGTRYIDFLIPGLIAMGILSSCLWGVGWSLIELRMKKMLRRIAATPMPKWLFMASHLTARMVFSWMEVLLLVGFAHFTFGFQVQGSWLAIFVLFFSAVVCFTGIAVFMAIRADNPTVGNGILNAIMLPMLFLSGIFFSASNYPSWMMPIINALPLTLVADGFRSIMNEGGTLSTILFPSCILMFWGTLFFYLGIRWFKWN